jgi:hypothetical protein
MYSWPTTARFPPIRHENERQAGRLRADATEEAEFQGRTLILKRIAVRCRLRSDSDTDRSANDRAMDIQAGHCRVDYVSAEALCAAFHKPQRKPSLADAADRTSASMQGRRRRRPVVYRAAVSSALCGWRAGCAWLAAGAAVMFGPCSG